MTLLFLMNLGLAGSAVAVVVPETSLAHRAGPIVPSTPSRTGPIVPGTWSRSQ